MRGRNTHRLPWVASGRRPKGRFRRQGGRKRYREPWRSEASSTSILRSAATQSEFHTLQSFNRRAVATKRRIMRSKSCPMWWTASSKFDVAKPACLKLTITAMKSPPISISGQVFPSAAGSNDTVAAPSPQFSTSEKICGQAEEARDCLGPKVRPSRGSTGRASRSTRSTASHISAAAAFRAWPLITKDSTAPSPQSPMISAGFARPCRVVRHARSRSNLSAAKCW